MATAKKTGTEARTNPRTPAKRSTAAKTNRATKTSAAASSGRTNSTRKGSQISLTEIPPSLAWQLWHLLKTSFLGKVLLFLLVFAIVVGMDILLAGNQFTRFAMILGIEVIIAAVAAWIVYMVRNRDEIFGSPVN